MSTQQTAHHPHAALLIDFDNVTMGIRSDLSKELKNLLSSDIIKGKVAVQRAYADWRRYPQYIVPLAESSVDLIFAPAYGSSKKNATDIRLAIDALELVFTRPEIGSFILLSGDSDFSSLVLKLKEYGKYVIGVGIRESASDLLVQNCDEYYSYSALTGLTRAGDEPRGMVASQDPWELVDIAVTQMAENNDVMRSDRLKQVMLEMDPTFDEKALGFQKFNRFMQDAAARGMVSLKKLENGQFEIGPAAPGARADAEEEEQRGNGRGRRSRRGGRGRGRDRSQHELPSLGEGGVAEGGAGDGGASDSGAGDEMPELDAATEPADVITAVAPIGEAEADASSDLGDAPAAAPDTLNTEEIVAEANAAPEENGASRSRRGRGGRGRGRGAGNTGEPKPIATGAELPPLEPAARDRGDASLLKQGYTLLRAATKDVLARGGSSARDSDVKRRMLELQPDWDEHPLGFSKFSRFLRQAHDAEVINLHKSDTGYDLTIGDGGGATAKDPSHRTGKTGRTLTGAGEAAPQTGLFEVGADAAYAGGNAKVEAPLGSQVTHAATPQSADKTAQPAASTQQPQPKPTPQPQPAVQNAAPGAMGFRRGSSRGRALGGPPPLLEGQTVAPPRAPAAPTPASNPFAALGFPTDPAAIATYLSEYKGVGPKSIQTLIETFGATNVFDALQNKPDRVREVVTGARGETLLDAWADDYTLRKAQSTPPEKQKAAPAAAKRSTAKKGPGGPRGAGGARGGAPRAGAPARGGAGGAKKGGAAPRRGGRGGTGRKPTKRA